MPVTYKEAVATQKVIEDNLLAQPGVVSVAVVKDYNMSTGQETGDWVIEIGFENEEVAKNIKIAPELKVVNELGIEFPNKFIKTRLTVEGKILAGFYYSAVHANTIGNQHSLKKFQNGVYTSRVRPCPCGYSAGHYQSNTINSTGTLGGLVFSNGEFQYFILSNNHVLASTDRASKGDSIIQPGATDGGQNTSHYGVGAFSYAVSLNSGVNYVDAAIAGLAGNWGNPFAYVQPNVQDIGLIAREKIGAVGMSIEKTGRTTGHTIGSIQTTVASANISYPTGTFTFKEQIRTSSISAPGDSGSLLFERGLRSVVGLLFAGSTSFTYYNHIVRVLDSLTAERRKETPNVNRLEFIGESFFQANKVPHRTGFPKRHFSTNLPRCSFFKNKVNISSFNRKALPFSLGYRFIK